MKQRFSSLDVKVIAHELSASLVSLRLSNIYDLSSKILLFKFAKPENKKQLLVDCGFRCHLTEFERITAALPSVFVQKLRKDLKTRRVTAISQIGTDRIIEIQFSDGLYRLYLEFFAGGNVILTNNELKILTLMRHVPEGQGQEPQSPGLTYSLENRQNYGGVPLLTKTRLKEALQTIIDKKASGNTSQKKPGDELRKGLAVTINELPPVLLDHAMKVSGFDSTLQPVTVRDDEALLDHLLQSLEGARNLVQDITSKDTCSGYIFAKSRAAKTHEPRVEIAEGEQPPRETLLYEEFHPFSPRQLEENPAFTVLSYGTFGKTVDEFFSSIEGQKLKSRLIEHEAMAKQKLEAAKADQAKRIEGLQAVQTLNVRKASAIEANIERVQEAMDAVNGLISHGMDWEDIGKLIERERRQGNPVAAIISLPLKLHENTVTVLLAEAEEDEESEEDEDYDSDSSGNLDSGIGGSTDSSQKIQGKRLAVDINLGLSPYSNAREYYEERKVAAVKEQKTKHQSEIALKSAGQKIEAELKKGLKQEKPLLQPIRRQAWFEKFIWFVSTDGYLVLGAKDSQQNELLYRQHLKKGDIYVHADLPGAACVVIKNNPNMPDAPIPPSTLSQAGSLVVCSSTAWDSKASMSAWWVTAGQVSKSALTGEFLPTGSFMISGKKNFLPASQLVMGIALMFKVSEDSKAKHAKHRIYDAPIESPTPSETPIAPIGPELVDNSVTQEEVVNAENDSDENASSEDSEPRENPLQPFGSSRDTGRVDTIDEAAVTSDQMEYLANTEIPADSKTTEPNQDSAQEEEVAEDDGVTTTERDTNPTSNPSQNSSSARERPIQPQNKAQPTKRGQRAKAKKIAAKYKDQDEEDRAAIEAIVGALAGKQRAEAEAKAKAEREAEIEATHERRRAQHQRQQRQTAEHEEVRKLMLDEKIGVLDPDEVTNLSLLDALVGTPLPGDEILEVVALCAPYSALGRCKYKIKLQPGAQKKGKAVKEILEMWKSSSAKKGVVDERGMDNERMWPREVELIKALKPEDIVNTVPLKNLKVMTSGGAAGGGGSGGGQKGKGGGKGGKKK